MGQYLLCRAAVRTGAIVWEWRAYLEPGPQHGLRIGPGPDGSKDMTSEGNNVRVQMSPFSVRCLSQTYLLLPFNFTNKNPLRS